MSPTRSPRPSRRRAAALALALLAACSKDSAPPQTPDAADVLVRERVAHWFDAQSRERAREALAPLVARDDARVEDLVRAAAIEFALSDAPRAEGFLARVEARDPQNAALHFLRGQMAREAGDPERAEAELRQALAAAPDDAPTKYMLAAALEDLDRTQEAEALLREVLAVGVENAGSWYAAALYRLERLLTFDERVDEAARLREEREALKARGIDSPSAVLTRLGTFGRIVPPRASGSSVPPPPASLAFVAGAPLLPELAGALELVASDVDGDGRRDLVARASDGVSVALARDGGWEVARAFEGPCELVRGFDLTNGEDGALELLVWTRGEPRFLARDGGAWRPLEVAHPELDAAPRDVVAVDYDHEGDLDLLLVGDFGARLWRNDGAAAGGAFVDATAAAGLPQGRAFAWALCEDFDADQDVDLLLGGPSGVFLADSLRGGRFADASARVAGVSDLERAPLAVDLDGDALPDLVTPGPQARLWPQRADHGFGPTRELGATPFDVAVTDLDLDGATDLVWGDAALLAAGLAQQTRARLAGVDDGDSAPQAVLDLDGDARPDLVRVGPEALLPFLASGPRGNAVVVVVRGAKSNRRAVGAVLEARAGAAYRRVYLRGEPQLVGCGAASKLDVLRITYPNGIVQSELDAPAGATPPDEPDGIAGLRSEPEGLAGSCPFLYTWNGRTFEFVTDVLGITPLGLPMAPGMLVPPDHDEYVLVRGEQLAPRDGRLVVQVTEELREVTYLDRVRLDVVDHPASCEVFPNELFCFPPFPQAHTHTVTDPLVPLRATGSDGRDWTAAVAARDDVHAVPFTKQPPQFQGLAEPWFVELAFDSARVRAANKLRLCFTGWFQWSDASVNMAAAYQPGVDFVPPILQVPDGQGGWRDAGPPVGFPAGKTKTMVVDVTDVLVREDPRVRVFTTLQLYWDRVVLATCDDDAPLETHALEPERADLALRGFSGPIETGRDDMPELFDWDVLAQEPRWNQHPGLYTKLGDCLELVTAVDDRFVILGAGDALEVSFDARALPPLKDGWRRDYLLFLDGWAKDRDPNTVEALEVEPLPFHGMSGYPYRADERFPDDAAHAAWRREWNTRPARTWIAPLAGRADAAQ